MSIARPESERESQQVLRTTHVNTRDAKWFSWTFVLILMVVPIVDVSSALAGRAAAAVDAPAASAASPGGWGLLRGEVLHAFERRIEEASSVRTLLQQRGQALLTQYLSFGTHDVVVGRDRWLYYRPGLEYVVGRDFRPAPRREWLKTTAAAHRRSPAEVIRQFDLECRTRGVHLVVVPIPDKASLQPLGLARRQTPERPDNAGYAAFVRALHDGGVDILEPPARVGEGRAMFLRQDTHWSPEYMTATAKLLAAHVSNRLGRPTPSPRYEVRPKPVAAPGDLLELLRLPAGQREFANESVTIEEVLDAGSGEPWAPEEGSRVILLGDSFSNVYSDGAGEQGLGWGSAAGLGPQLSRFLNEPVDVIAINGSGATATRRTLARRPAPFENKAVIIWQFAARDLATEDWDVVPFASPASSEPGIAPVADRLVVQARIVKTSRVPDPATAPYSDCLNFVLLQVERVESGTYRQDLVLAVFRTMQDRRLLPAASYRTGDRLRLTLVPLRDAGQDLLGIRQSDDTGDYEHLPYFVLLAEAM